MAKPPATVPDSMRLDKWLWCARFCKTRGDAAEALRSGKVLVTGQRLKPARLVKVGMVLQLRSGAISRDITVLALSSRRLSPAAAIALYLESAESISRREELATQMKQDRALNPRPRGRPTKRQRRKIIQFRRRVVESDPVPDEDDDARK